LPAGTGQSALDNVIVGSLEDYEKMAKARKSLIEEEEDDRGIRIVE
jgi:hypothetical protein